MMTIFSIMTASGNEGIFLLLFSLLFIYFLILTIFFSGTIRDKLSCDFGDFDVMMTTSSIMMASTSSRNKVKLVLLISLFFFLFFFHYLPVLFFRNHLDKRPYMRFWRFWHDLFIDGDFGGYVACEYLHWTSK
jgi:hypothetical protein